MADDLRKIVQRMVEAGESESAIATVVQNYKPGTPKKKGASSDGYTPSVLTEKGRENYTPPVETPENNLGLGTTPQTGIGSNFTTPATQGGMVDTALFGDGLQKAQSQRLSDALGSYQQANPDQPLAEGRDQGVIDHTTTETGWQRTKGRSAFVYNNLLTSLGSIAAGIGDVAMQIPTGQNSGMASTRTTAVDPLMLGEYREEVAPQIRESLLNAIGAEMTDQERSRWQGEFLTGSIGGLAGSLPAMLGGKYRAGLFFLQSYDSSLESISQADVNNDISQNNRTLYATVVGAISAKLETLSFDRIFKGKTKALADQIAKEVLEETASKGQKATSETISKGIKARIKKLSESFVKKGDKIVDAIETEAWTEGAQDLSNTGMNAITNLLSGKDVFEIEDFTGIVGNTLYASAQGGVGGGIMGGVATALPSKSKVKVDENTEKLKQIDEYLDTDPPQLQADAAIKQKIKLQDEIDTEEAKAAKKFRNLSEDNSKKVTELQETIERNEGILEDPNVPAAVKEGVAKENEKAISELDEILASREKAIEKLEEVKHKEEEAVKSPKKTDDVTDTDVANKQDAPKSVTPAKPAVTPAKKAKAPVKEEVANKKPVEPKKTEPVAKTDQLEGDVVKSDAPKAEQPRAIRPLVDTMKRVFGLGDKQAKAAAKVHDKVMGNIAERTGQTKTQAYEAVKFVKADPETQRKIKEAKTPEEARKVIEGALFQMIGPKGAEKAGTVASLDAAMILESEGADKDTIWRLTGWENTNSGWQSEVEPQKFKKFSDFFKRLKKPKTFQFKKGPFREYKMGTIGDFVDAEELFKHYPELKNVPIMSYADGRRPGTLGGYDTETRSIEFNRSAFDGMTEAEAQQHIYDTIIHESQHFIQSLEGQDNGSNQQKAADAVLNYYGEELREAYDKYKKDNQNPKEYSEFAKEYLVEKQGADSFEQLAFDFYQNNEGEINARNAADRDTGLTAQQRKRTPLSVTENVVPGVPRTSGHTLFQIIGQKGAIKISPELIKRKEKAERMKKEGYKPEYIFKQTGWKEESDGWKLEIPDGEVKNIEKITDLLNDKIDGPISLGTLQDFYESDDLFKAYPDLRNTKVELHEGKSKRHGGGFNPRTNTLAIGRQYYENLLVGVPGILGGGRRGSGDVSPSGSRPGISAKADGAPQKTIRAQEHLKNVIIHEVQHYVQFQEGFNPGSSPEFAKYQLKEKYADEINDQIQERGIEGDFGAIYRLTEEIISKGEGYETLDDAAKAYYNNAPGEVEARKVQDRSKMTDEERSDTMFQRIQGAVQLYESGEAIIHALTDPNVSTPMHELAHVYEQYLTKDEVKTIEEWSGKKKGTVAFSEAFAEGFETYLQEGKAPVGSRMKKIFEGFRDWLVDIYRGVPRERLNDPMRRVYDAMLGHPRELSATEKALEGEPSSWQAAVLRNLLSKSPLSTKSYVDRTGFGWYVEVEGRKGRRRATKEQTLALLNDKNYKEEGVRFIMTEELQTAKLKGHVADDGIPLDHYIDDYNGEYDEGEMMDYVVQNINEGKILDKLQNLSEEIQEDAVEDYYNDDGQARAIVQEMIDRHEDLQEMFTPEELEAIFNEVYGDYDLEATEATLNEIAEGKALTDAQAQELQEFIDNEGSQVPKIIEQLHEKETERQNASDGSLLEVGATEEQGGTGTSAERGETGDILFQSNKTTENEQGHTVNEDTGIESETFIAAVNVAIDTLKNNTSGYRAIKNAREFLRVQGVSQEKIQLFTRHVTKQLRDAGQETRQQKYDQNTEVELPDFSNDPKKSWIENLTDGIRKEFKKWMDYKGGLGSDFYRLREHSRGQINKHVRKASILGNELKRIVRKDKSIDWKDIDSAIRGDAGAIDVLPDRVAAIVVEMRAHIDAMSQSLINDGVVIGDTLDSVKNNLGSYLHRSYMLHNDKNWKLKNIPDNIVNSAKEAYYRIHFDQAHRDAVKEKMREMTAKEKNALKKDQSLRQQFEKEVMEIAVESARQTAINSVEALFEKNKSPFSKSPNSEATDGSILKHRDLNLPIEIRALMGEYTDPIANYVKTIAAIASLHSSNTYLNNIKNAGLNKIFFEKNNVAGHYVKIVNEGSGSLSPLNGLYTTPEMAEVFSKTDKQIKGAWRWFMARSSEIKAMKTIYSVATHIKNIEGGIGFSLMNGHFDLMQAKDAGKAFAAEWSGINNQAFKDIIEPLIEYNVLGQNIITSELRALTGEDAFNYYQRGTGESSQQMPARGLFGKFKKAAGKVLTPIREFSEKSYEMEDAYFKIYGYLNDVNRYSEALMGKKYHELDDKDKKFIQSEMAEMVKNTYPTYSRMPRIVKMISKWPIGNFIGFASESYRVAYNSASLAIKEATSSNPKLRKIGAQRLAGIAMYKGLKLGLMKSIGVAGFGAVTGYFFDDDDEKQTMEDARRFVAPWSKNSDIIVYPTKDGVMEYFDFSSYDPFGMQESLVNAMWNAESVGEGIENVGLSFLEPFTDEDLFLGTALKVYKNENHYGGKIYEIDDTRLESLMKTGMFTGKAFAPGTYASFERLLMKGGKATDFIYRNYEIELPTAFRYKIKDINEKISAANRRYYKAEREHEKGSSELKQAKERQEQYIGEALDALREDYEAALRLGANEKDLSQEMKTQRLNLKRRRGIKSGKKWTKDALED